MASKQLTKDPLAGLPDLVPTSSDDFNIDARDVQPPRIKAASPTSAPVGEGLVPLFSLYTTKGRDDDNPQVIVEAGAGAEGDEGFLVYVLRMYKTRSASVNPNDYSIEQRQGGELRSWSFDDPAAPPFARTGYNYVLYAPDAEDADLPHNLLLANSATPTARLINTLLMQRSADGMPIYVQPFRLWAEKREATRDGQTNRWAVVKARPVEPVREHVETAQAMSALVNRTRPAAAPAAPTSDAPAI